MARNEYLDDMELENRITSMPDRELSEFTAREVCKANRRIDTNCKRLDSLESRSNKFTAGIASLGVFIGGIIVGVVEYLRGG